MGGLGAKQRRRMQRDNQETNIQSEHVRRNHSTSPAKNRVLFTKGESDNIPKEKRGKQFNSNTQQHKPAKFKKPKHLKRKLEQLVDNDTQERVRLLEQLSEFETAKELTRKRASNKRKKHKQQVEENVQNNATRSPSGDSAAEQSVKQMQLDKEITSESKDIVTEKAAIAKNKSSVVEDTNDDEKSDQDENGERKRQRGRRRRGRKDTSKLVEENEKEKTVPIMEKSQESAEQQPTKAKDPSRYCVGRRPVTDYSVGQTYPGKVVYVKPFGIFIDIGCHSDAFCHISRLADDYVESPYALYKQGDDVVARVVEVERRQKRITVSLQSEAMIPLEHSSIESRGQRLGKRTNKKEHEPSNATAKKEKEDSRPGSHFACSTTVAKTEEKTPEATKAPANAANDKPQSQMTAADLKRVRKLQRRADRRAQNQENVHDRVRQAQ